MKHFTCSFILFLFLSLSCFGEYSTVQYSTVQYSDVDSCGHMMAVVQGVGCGGCDLLPVTA